MSNSPDFAASEQNLVRQMTQVWHGKGLETQAARPQNRLKPGICGQFLAVNTSKGENIAILPQNG